MRRTGQAGVGAVLRLSGAGRVVVTPSLTGMQESPAALLRGRGFFHEKEAGKGWLWFALFGQGRLRPV